MKKKIIENKYIILSLVLLFALIVYCGLQTLVINDDLPYSLFYRSDVRITTIKQIVLNQLSDYLTINGRFFIHCVVQFVLIFGKKLFAILNAGFIIVSVVFMKKIIDLKVQNKKIKNICVFWGLIGGFLLLGKYKYLVYWVAGSVNYIWLFALLLIFIYYYLVCGLEKHKIITSILIFAFSMVHECSFVFMLFLILSDLVKKLIEKKQKFKFKEYYIYLVYLLIAILGGLVVLKAPGNILRMQTAAGWYEMSLINRIQISIPIVSKNLFQLFNLDNLIPTIFIFVFILYTFKSKYKYNKIISLTTILISVLAFILNNGWLYFVLSILIFINLILLNYNEKNNQMSVVLVAMYSVVFSMIITPEFAGERPNYYIYIWMIINIFIYLNMIISKNIIIRIIEWFLAILVIVMGINEFNIYYSIGLVKKERFAQIEKVKKENLKVLEYKIIDERFAKYHADPNSPSDSNYWAYRYFIYYYNLPDDIEIKLVD